MMRRVLFGLFTYAEFILLLALFLPVFVVVRIAYRRDLSRRIPGRLMRRFGRLSSSLSPFWHFSVDGAVPEDIKKSAYVIVSNHESTADPFLLSFLRLSANSSTHPAIIIEVPDASGTGFPGGGTVVQKVAGDFGKTGQRTRRGFNLSPAREKC